MNLAAAKQKRAIFSICSNNYFPYARVLFTSLKQYHPEAALFLCLADIPQPGVELNISEVEVIPVADLGIDHFPDFAFRYDIMEFNTAVKPFMMDWLIREGGFEQVVYLDPDIEVFAPMQPVFAAFDEGADFTITPHITAPAEFAEFPDDIGIMKAGIYNLGFIGMNNSQEVQDFLQWWKRRLRYQCVNQQEAGIFVDQKFIDLLPAFASQVAIIRDRTLNVAYWNLEQRKLTKTTEGWLVDGEPLIFFHFSGIIPQQPQRLSKHTERFQDNLEPALQNIIQHYLANLAQFTDISAKTSYGYGKFNNQIAIADIMRYCYRDTVVKTVSEKHPNPFETFHLELNQPSGIDLQIAYDLNHLRDRLNYTLWFVQNATEYGIDDYFLTPILDTKDPTTRKYRFILLLTKLLGQTTWQMRTLLKKSLWLPRKLTKPLRLLLK
jgi:hypothetical protein